MDASRMLLLSPIVPRQQHSEKSDVFTTPSTPAAATVEEDGSAVDERVAAAWRRLLRDIVASVAIGHSHGIVYGPAQFMPASLHLDEDTARYGHWLLDAPYYCPNAAISKQIVCAASRAGCHDACRWR